MKARFTDEQIIAMIKEQEAGEKNFEARSNVFRGNAAGLGAAVPM